MIGSPFRIQVLSGFVPREQCDLVTRRIWLYVREYGISTQEIAEWEQVACPFPALRYVPEVIDISKRISRILGLEDDQLCEPQLIFHLPQSDAYNDPPLHVDFEPPWADGRHYSQIVGVALSDWTDHNGALRWRSNSASLVYGRVQMQPGDAVVIDPLLPHSAGVNRSAQPRLGIYFRWLRNTPESIAQLERLRSAN